MGAIDWLRAAAAAFSEVLVERDFLTSSEQGCFAVSAEEMIADIR